MKTMHKAVLATLLVVGILLTGCFPKMHVVGTGSNNDGGMEKTYTNWYVLWGLIPLNKKDPKDIKQGDGNYTVETKFDGVNVIINIFTGIITIYSENVYVRD